MRTIILALSLLGISASLLQGTPALAQLSRTWVSSTGDDDSLSCGRTNPCATFGGAFAKTAAGGIIGCIDTGTFGLPGGLTINKSIEIDCLNTRAGVVPGNFRINTAGITVVLRGLAFDGIGIGTIGVHIAAAATVHIEKSTIRGFRNNDASGVRVSNVFGVSRVYISDTNITDNGTGTTGGGVLSVPAFGGGGGFSLVELSNVKLKNNTWGVGNTANSRMRISHSSIAGSEIGLLNDPGSIVTLNDVDIVYNNTGISGATTSYGNNRISGQLTSDGTPPTPAGAQSHDTGQR